MLSAESALRNLPSNIDPSQAFLFDGLRHAFEIAEIACARLRETLTDLVAIAEKPSDRRTRLISSAYLDAWAIVDSADRFRSLWQLSGRQLALPLEPLAEGPILSSVRQLRNVSDHLAQRTDFVLSKRATALGVLSWFTALERNPVRGYLCAILPGTAIDVDANLAIPNGRSFPWPTGSIWLEAAGFRVCIDDVLPVLRQLISLVEEIVQRGNFTGAPAVGRSDVDVIVKAFVQFD